MRLIPFFPNVSSHINFNVNLGELVCDFTFNWNVRIGSWFCDFRTSAGENKSVKIVEKSSLLGNSNFTGLNGDFRVLRTNKLCKEGITFDNFGSDWVLVYGSHEEWKEYDDSIQS